MAASDVRELCELIRGGLDFRSTGGGLGNQTSYYLANVVARTPTYREPVPSVKKPKSELELA